MSTREGATAEKIWRKKKNKGNNYLVKIFNGKKT